MSSAEYEIYLVISWRPYAQYKLPGSTSFAFSKGEVSRYAVGSGLDMLVFNRGFIESSLIILLACREVHFGIRDIRLTITKHSISPPDVVHAVATASSSISG
jgi:hypothetical protein